MAQEQWKADGLTFDVRVDGPADGEPVVLLHGFPQNSAEWRAVSAELNAAGYQTLAPDQRGYSPGARPSEVRDYRLEKLVADIVALLDARGLSSAHIVGHDWGAAVAWSMAAQVPDRVRTLTAVSVPHPAALTTAIKTDRDQQRKSAYMLFFRRPAGMAERVLLALNAKGLRTVFRGAGLSAAEIDTYVRPLRQPGALTAALNWYRAMSSRESHGLPPVKRPTTYVWSDKDLALGRAAATACGLYVEGEYEFVEFGGVTHWIPDQAPDRLAEVILARIAD